jgi:hypothetical protein
MYYTLFMGLTMSLRYAESGKAIANCQSGPVKYAIATLRSQ